MLKKWPTIQWFATWDRNTIILLVLFGFVLLTQPLLTGCRESADTKYHKLADKYHNYRKTGKDSEARLTLLNMIDLKPDNPDLYRDLADLLLKNRQVKEALGTYRTVLNLRPDDFEARFRIASILLAGNQPELAQDHVYKLMDKRPDDRRSRLLLALLKRQQRNPSEALSILSQLEKEAPEDPEVLGSIAYLKIDQGDRQAAEEYLIRAISRDQKNITLRVTLADIFAGDGRLDEAQDLLSLAVEGNPDDASMRYLYAEFLFGRGIRSQAESEFRLVLSKNPTQHLARDRLYDILLIRRDKQAANQLTTELIQTHPKDPGTDYFRARDMELEGKFDEALPLFIRAIEEMPQFFPAFRRAGLIELRQGERKVGLEHLRQAVGINSNDVGARLALAREAFLNQQFGEAAGHVDKILSKYPTQLAAHVIKADLALIQGDIQTARRVYAFLSEKRPDNTLGFLKLGLLEERSGNLDAALTNYEKALMFDANSLIPARRAARIIVAKNGLRAGLQYLKDSEERVTTGRAVFRYLRAALLMTSEQPSTADFSEAESLLTTALAENPNLLPAYGLLARVKFAQQDFAGVIANYEKWLEQAPHDFVAMIQLGMTYEAVGRKDDARKIYYRALTEDPRNPIAANNLAWLLLDPPHENLDEAERLAKIAKQQLPKQAAITDTLAWVYFKRGQIRLALSLAKDAKELLTDVESDDAETKEILRHLEIIKQENEKQFPNPSPSASLNTKQEQIHYG